jgi:hypothetical protein
MFYFLTLFFTLYDTMQAFGNGGWEWWLGNNAGSLGKGKGPRCICSMELGSVCGYSSIRQILVLLAAKGILS